MHTVHGPPRPPHAPCEAVQHSDSMVCSRCGLTWDVNEPWPPVCRHDHPLPLAADSIDRDQVRYALERQGIDLEALADRLSRRGDYAAEFPAADAERLREAIVLILTPIDMVLHCPACHLQHIDAPEVSPVVVAGFHVDDVVLWTNPPHRSHLCAGCGFIWRPADVPTNGVQAVKTRGKHDS